MWGASLHRCPAPSLSPEPVSCAGESASSPPPPPSFPQVLGGKNQDPHPLSPKASVRILTWGRLPPPWEARLSPAGSLWGPTHRGMVLWIRRLGHLRAREAPLPPPDCHQVVLGLLGGTMSSRPKKCHQGHARVPISLRPDRALGSGTPADSRAPPELQLGACLGPAGGSQGPGLVSALTCQSHWSAPGQGKAQHGQGPRRRPPSVPPGLGMGRSASREDRRGAGRGRMGPDLGRGGRQIVQTKGSEAAVPTGG